MRMPEPLPAHDAEVTELSLLLPSGQFRALSHAAEERDLTVAQLVRSLLRKALAEIAPHAQFSQRRSV